jgi:quaternary ammonium compound-resistance protein SugE
MAWVILFAVGFLEVGWAVAMKQSHGFTRLVPSLVTLAGMAGSVVFLALAMRSLPLGTAYTVWTGIGAVGAFIVGITFLGEPANAMRLTAAATIVVGLVLIKLAPAE